MTTDREKLDRGARELQNLHVTLRVLRAYAENHGDDKLLRLLSSENRATIMEGQQKAAIGPVTMTKIQQFQYEAQLMADTADRARKEMEHLQDQLRAINRKYPT